MNETPNRISAEVAAFNARESATMRARIAELDGDPTVIYRYRITWPATGETRVWELRGTSELADALRLVCLCERDRTARLGVPTIERLS